MSQPGQLVLCQTNIFGYCFRISWFDPNMKELFPFEIFCYIMHSLILFIDSNENWNILIVVDVGFYIIFIPSEFWQDLLKNNSQTILTKNVSNKYVFGKILVGKYKLIEIVNIKWFVKTPVSYKPPFSIVFNE